MRLIKLALAVLLFVGSSAYANGALVGIKTVNILVEDVDEDATKCGITKDALDAAARLPLSNSRIVVDSQSSQYLYVNVSVLRAGSLCIASFHVGFNKFVPSEFSTGEFWSKGSLTSGSVSFVSRSVVDGVEGFTKQFLAAWLKANSK